jgi:hypothetical protein
MELYPLLVTVTVSRPPLGLKPRFIHDEQRHCDVVLAIQRYRDAGLDVPVEWYEEMHELSVRLGV